MKIFLLTNILLLIYYITESNEVYSIINLTIKGTGKQQILYDNSIDGSESLINKNQIDRIYVNGNIQNEIDYFVYNLTEPINNVTISFNTQFTNIKSMFYNCTSIVWIDLSDFDTSQVSNMERIVSECGSLTSINLNNLNTQKLKNMNAMFYNCYSLLSLDLSTF